ncbi:glycosyltransferase [Burkholderia vietnamiensis]|uniref:glycosyltransferase n=1 Tax=Burkholderia vietnamiensis TaxID=60552 RepID=UPI000A96E4D7|nr:glycosyltransferase [Burkholderia vietnamiensis]MDN8044767.1 glycosyltransferase [Burkholderia vietnamiensis]HDR9030068.1 glycosyltransferase [Burkholderia vietnamiensis]HDR9131588.1 glycosyltransferase [Burkholderia vietnamiensis]
MVIQKRVAIVYHFFPHYRKGILDLLCRTPEKYSFFGDSIASYEGIPAFKFPDDCDFRSAPVRKMFGQLFQWRAVRAAASPEFSCIVLLANPNFVTTWIAALVARLMKKRVIFWGHGFLSPERDLKNYIRKIFFSLASAMYLYGYRAKVIAKEFGFQSERLYVGFNSLDYDRQLIERSRLDSKNHSSKGRDGCSICPDVGAISLLGVSRLTAKCQYDVLIKALAAVSAKSEKKFNLTLIGSGPEESRLKELAKSLGVNVEFLGEIYEEDVVAQYIFDADAVISPGKVGLTAMHALMFGTPVVTHGDMSRQMPEAEAVVEDISGILFKYGDVIDLMRALQKIPILVENRDEVRISCYRIMDEIYNPRRQLEVLIAATEGMPASEGDDILGIWRAS